MAPKKGQKSRTMRGKKDFTTKKTSKYHDRHGHYKKKMGRPYRKARKSTRGAHHGGLWQTFNEGVQMRKGGVVRSGPSAVPPALFTRGMRRGGVYPVMVGMRWGGSLSGFNKGAAPTNMACRDGPFGNTCG